MFLLVSGASGVGKSTARLGAVPLLGSSVEAIELWHLGPIPAVPTIAWRQEMVELAVRRATALEADGRHLLMAGDPVPAGEVLAAPSAADIDVAVCLLDADAESQSDRLRARHEPEELLARHLAFAAWMRVHAVDPSHLPEVVTTDAWPAMRWERWVGTQVSRHWAMTVLDTSARDPADVAHAVAAWCGKALDGSAPVFRRGWFREP